MAAVQFDLLRPKAFDSITTSYTTLGPAMTQNLRTFCIVNNTDGDMFISNDGTNDRLFIPANSFRLYDCATNAPNVHNTDSFVIGIGVQIYVRYSSAPTKGAVYLEGLYAMGV